MVLQPPPRVVRSEPVAKSAGGRPSGKGAANLARQAVLSELGSEMLHDGMFGVTIALPKDHGEKGLVEDIYVLDVSIHTLVIGEPISFVDDNGADRQGVVLAKVRRNSSSKDCVSLGNNVLPGMTVSLPVCPSDCLTI
eukprot:COSAG02_NODE_2329_length_9121_cov_3.015183_11_plen_138_part_00